MGILFGRPGESPGGATVSKHSAAVHFCSIDQLKFTTMNVDDFKNTEVDHVYSQPENPMTM